MKRTAFAALAAAVIVAAPTMAAAAAPLPAKDVPVGAREGGPAGPSGAVPARGGEFFAADAAAAGGEVDASTASTVGDVTDGAGATPGAVAAMPEAEAAPEADPGNRSGEETSVGEGPEDGVAADGAGEGSAPAGEADAANTVLVSAREVESDAEDATADGTADAGEAAGVADDAADAAPVEAGDGMENEADGAAPGEVGEDVASVDDAAVVEEDPLAEDPAVKAAREAEEERLEQERATAELCGMMTAAAAEHGVPQGFFIRLIFKESRFNPGAVSPVGAQGIAQFMPGTARLRGLKNPFDPREALFASAAFLAEMKAEFGSWGLAAAGYNGGPNRVPRFVAGEGGLPYETVDYVFSITGRTASYWAARARRMMVGVFPEDIDALPGEPMPLRYVEPIRKPVDDGWRRRGDLSLIEPAPVFQPIAFTPDGEEAGRAPGPPPRRPDVEPGPVDCPALVARLGQSRSVAPPSGMGGATLWAAQVAGHPKRAVAMAQYARLKGKLPADLVAQGPRVVVRRFAARGRLAIHAVQFGAPDRKGAEELCRRIAKTLTPCVVVKNG